MKGVILAGGEGTRLRPLTVVTNKHLLPVYNKPVIFYAIEKLMEAGIDRIMVVTSPQQMDNFVSLLGSGQNFVSKKTGKQIQIVYGIQNRPSGIADGLYIAKDYVGDDDCVLYLGDNIFEDDISSSIANFKKGALVFLKEVKNPERFGVAAVDRKGHVLAIEEKPAKPKSDLAVTGVYVYDNTVFDKMKNQPKSGRGEYEITYINNAYIKEGALRAIPLKKEWFDIGAVESLHEASVFMKSKRESRARSLSIFFPCYNDKGTIGTLVLEAKAVAEKLTDDFEVIVVDDGSTDGSRELLLTLQKEWPELKLVFHEKNRGYGCALQSGFKAATKEFIFYTDGDAQYNVGELPLLWEKLTPDVDIVNGYKIKRHDPLHRIVIGYIYQWVIRIAFLLPIRDIDCDFRLIRRKVFGTIELKSNTGTITVELIKKIQQAGFHFIEAPVSHSYRMYGTSQFFSFRRITVTLWRLLFLWFDLMLVQKLTRPEISIILRKIVAFNFRKEKRYVREYLACDPDDKILDLGCGTGEFSVFFNKENYVGIDIDPKNVAFAQKYSDKNFMVADARHLPFPDESFNKILVDGVFHHLSDDDAQSVLREMKRVLKRGGVALVMEDTKHWNPLTKIMHHFDRGSYIRSAESWNKLFGKYFTIENSWSFFEGVCFYYSFIMK